MSFDQPVQQGLDSDPGVKSVTWEHNIEAFKFLKELKKEFTREIHNLPKAASSQPLVFSTSSRDLCQKLQWTDKSPLQRVYTI